MNKMDLEDYRKRIDDIDSQIIELLARRLQIVKEVRNLKLKNNMPLYDERREFEILASVEELSREYGLDSEYVLEIFKRILSESHRI